MRVLALDYGTARIGCAVSDATGTLATPIAAVEPPDCAAVAALAREREAERIVVGLPVSLSGGETGQAALTRSFCADLTGLVDIPVEVYDERFTTRMAARTRRSAGSAANEDSIAAAHLLESYLTAASGKTPGE